jgi:hypothetical protein
MQVSADSYEEYQWHTFQEEIHDCIEDSRHVFRQGHIQYNCCRHVESDLQIEQDRLKSKEYVVISCRRFEEVFRMVK